MNKDMTEYALELMMNNEKARRVLAKFELMAKERGWDDEQYRENRSEVIAAVILGIPEIHDKLTAAMNGEAS